MGLEVNVGDGGVVVRRVIGGVGDIEGLGGGGEGMTLFGRAANRHFLCYSGLERFDSEPEPQRAPVRVVAG